MSDQRCPIPTRIAFAISIALVIALDQDMRPVLRDGAPRNRTTVQALQVAVRGSAADRTRAEKIRRPEEWILNERIETGNRILDGIPVSVIVPPGLVVAFAQLVTDYAAQHGESLDDCIRAVEIGVLHLGIRAMRETLSENKRLATVMGWPREEDGGA